MKSRLSFVVTGRRPSAKPGEMEAKSPKGNAGEDDAPFPEPMGGLPSPEPMVGRPSDLNQVQTNKSSGEITSPSGSGANRKKSFADMGGRKKSGNALFQSADESSDSDTDASQVFPSSVREGFLKKKGVINIAWKRRYLVLLPHQLAYYDEKPKTSDTAPKGFVNLTSITKVDHHTKNSTDDFTFDVCTPTRIYRLQAASVADMEAWIAAISGTAANNQQQLASRKRNVSHAATLLMNDDERLKKDISVGISHENADLKSWATWNAFEVAAWLQTFGMARYCEAFYNKGVTGATLKSLDKKYLADEAGDQVKILAHVKQLMSGGPTPGVFKV